MVYSFIQKKIPFRHSASGIKSSVLDWQDEAFVEALRALPEDEDFPHDLIRLLATPNAGQSKKIWLITRDGAPIAVAPLRKIGRFTWQPATQYILPGVVIPTTSENLFPALGALGLKLRVAFWRTNYTLPQAPLLHEPSTTITHGFECTEDFEAYWKHTNMWRHLRSAKNKWGHLTLRENAPGASEWIISNWAKKWGVAEGETHDRIAAARFLEERGKHFSLTLFDGDRPVAGQTCVSHRGETIGQCIYRENEHSALGNRVIHLAFCWAKEKGFRAIDIGGGHDYKSKFAPPRGERHEFTLTQPWRDVTERAARSLKRYLRSSPAVAPVRDPHAV